MDLECPADALQSNAKFAVAIDRDNAKLQERKKLIDEQRSRVGHLTCDLLETVECCMNCINLLTAAV